jgi:hypothetical protein
VSWATIVGFVGETSSRAMGDAGRVDSWVVGWTWSEMRRRSIFAGAGGDNTYC